MMLGEMGWAEEEKNAPLKFAKAAPERTWCLGATPPAFLCQGPLGIHLRINLHFECCKPRLN